MLDKHIVLMVPGSRCRYTREKTVVLPQRRVAPVLNFLAARGDMIEEKATIIGKLKKVDIERGEWRIASRDPDDAKKEKDYSGRVEDISLLSGLETDAEYSVECIEQISDEPLTLKEITDYIAKKFVPVNTSDL